MLGNRFLIPPTGIAIANTPIYTWPGKSNDIGLTLTPTVNDPEFIRWLQSNSNTSPGIGLNKDTDTGSKWSARFNSTNNPGYQAAEGVKFTLTGRLHNNSEATTDIYARLNMWGRWGNDWNSGTVVWMNIGSGISWAKASTTLKGRAYYAKDATQFAKPTDINGDNNLTKIPTTEYTVTSSDTLKEVTITYTFGNQTFTDVLTLLKN